MNEANEKRLCMRFPSLYRNGGPRWGFECGDGWFDLIWRLSERIEQAAADAGLDPASDAYPYAAQVKEKFGGLRFYVHGELPDDADAAIDAAEIESRQICFFCGSPAEMRSSGGWYRPACDRHARTR